MRRAVLRNPETEPREEQEDRHERERGQQQVAPTKSVNRVKRWEGKQPVDDTEPKRRREGRGLWEAGVDEDLGRVVRNRIDAAELLHEHDDLGGDHGVAVSADSEQLLDLTSSNVHGLPLDL